MKRVLLILAAIMFVFAVVGCNSNGAPTTVVDKSQPTPTTPTPTTPTPTTPTPTTPTPSTPETPSFNPVINNPQFTGWGGVGSTGVNNTFHFDTIAANNCRATYTIPEEALDYTNLTLEYTLTLDENETLPMKVTIKNSLKDNWGGTTGDEYKQSATNANMTYTALVSKFTTGAITFAHNTNNDESSSFVITFTKITFSN